MLRNPAAPEIINHQVINPKSLMNPSTSQEWLEADGRGGFASATTSGIRTRRYHALLLTATTPPSGRLVLVNGFDAWIENAADKIWLSAQRYASDSVSQSEHLRSFQFQPWPHLSYRLTV